MTQGWKKAVSVMLCAAMILSMSSVMISADELNQPTTGVEQTQPENENTNETPEENKENTDNNTENEDEQSESQVSEAVKNVIAQLEALPKLDDLTEGTDTEALKNQVESAKAAFDALTEEEKAGISEELKGNLADLDIFVTNFIVNTPTAIPETESDKVVSDQDGIVTLEEVTLEGKGTKEEPYQIKDAGDFNKALESKETTIYMQLEANITDTLTVSAGKSVVLNLNGYTLTNKDGQHTINNEGTLTVNGNGTVDNVSHAKAAVYNAQNATVTLNGGIFTRSKESGKDTGNSGGNSYYTLQNLGDMTINENVSVNQGADQKGRFSSLIANGWYNGNQNTSKKEANLIINGGDISGGLNAVKNDDYGNLVINGGTFRNTAQAVVMNWNKTEIKGGTFTSEADVIANGKINDTMDKGELIITGGTFTAGANGKVIMISSSATTGGTISVTNATMTGDLDLKKNANVIISNTKVDGTITVEKDTSVEIKDGSEVTKPLAGEGAANVTITDSTVAGNPVTNNKPFEVDGDKKYATLAEAIQNVKDGGTIKLLADVPNAVGISVPGGKNFTLDFNNHTYTLKTPGAGSPNTETNGFQFLQGSTITLKNGTIRISEDNKPAGDKKPIMRIIQNYADLTLENMQIYAKNQYGGEDYPLSFNNGNIHFKGNTSIYTSSDNNIAFDVDNFSAYPSAIVTFDEDYTGTINGRIVYDGENKDTHKIIIKGNGTFGKIDAAADVNDAAAKDGAIEIHGGSFAESVEEYVIPELNYELHSYDGRYTYYHTLEEAKDAAQGVGGVITDVDTGNVVVTVKPDDSKPSKPSKPSNGGSSNSGSSNSGSSNSGTTVDKEEEDYNEFWDKVIDRINKADEGDTVTVHAGNYDKMPNKVMKALEKNGVGLIIKYNGGEIEIPAGEAVNKSNKLFWSFKELGNYVFATEDNDEQNNDKQDNEQNNGSENNTQSNTQTEQKPFGTVETKPNPQTGSEDYVGLAAALAVTAGVAAIGLGKKKKDEE